MFTVLYSQIVVAVSYSCRFFEEFVFGNLTLLDFPLISTWGLIAFWESSQRAPHIAGRERAAYLSEETGLTPLMDNEFNRMCH